MKDKTQQRLEILKRVRRDMDSQRMKDRMKTVDWKGLYESKDINVINASLEEKILEAYDQEAPLKVVQVRKSHKNWLGGRVK